MTILLRSIALTRITNLFAAAFIAISMSGCAVVDGGPAAPPSHLSDGIHSHEFIDKAPFQFDVKYVDVSSTYKGQWVANHPKGQGEVTSSYGLSCRGEFGIEPVKGYFAKPVYPDLYYTGSSEKSSYGKEYYVWARGDVFYQGQLIFTGLFRNKFYWGEGCLPAGDGVWVDRGSRITGNFWTDLATRQVAGRVLIRDFMIEGPCQIARKDGAFYKGNCDAPDKSKSKKGSVYLNSVDLSDPFILADGIGTFTESDGRSIAGAQAKSKADDMRWQLQERERERIARERAEQRERQENERMRREAEESGPSTASQIALFGSLMANSYQQQQSLKAAEIAANQRRLDAVQASERRTAQRNEQMLASVAEERKASQQKQQYQQTQSAGSQSSQVKPIQAAQADTRSTGANDNATKAAALKAQQDLEQKRQENAQRAKEASDRAREQEENRQRIAREKADKLAAEQAEKAAEQQAQKNYLNALIQGIHLVATKCPDGEGHYYATGSMPKVKKEVVSCIDVSYEASCPGSRQVITGVAKNFIGMSGCFGDTYQIDPKPACAVKDVRIRVTDVRPGCN